MASRYMSSSSAASDKPAWYISPSHITDRSANPIGRGIFGEVYVGNYNDIKVVIREIPRVYQQREPVAFRHLTKRWHDLSHPHVLSLLAACDQDADGRSVQPFIVSSFMPNGTLRDYVSDPNTVRPLTEKLKLLTQVASGMSYLHDHSILHGNLKAQNILLDGDFQSVVSDFGFIYAHQTPPSPPSALAGSSLDYIAPEMLDDEEPSGHTKKTDVFAFAITMYETLNDGKDTWVTADGEPMRPRVIEMQICRGNRPAKINDLPNDVWGLIEHCWHQDPRARPTFAEVLARLQDLTKASAAAPRPRPQQSHHPVKANSWRITFNDITDHSAEPIGTRGFGVVYTGRYNGAKVIVRQLRELLDRGMELSLFADKMKMWWTLDHPHVLSLIGAGEIDGYFARPFMVSPFMPNGTLLQYVSSPRRSCSIDEKLQLLYQVSSGMTYLHEEKLLHGDLKAQSVLLDESFRAVITDFGFAEANSAPELRAPRTVDHMAPEMLDDRRPCRPTAKTDIYAFAITMYEVLCSGGPIWVGRDGQVIDESQIALYCRRGQRPKRLDDVPDDIWMLMEECWRDNPSERLFFVEILVRLEDYRQ